MRPGSGLEASFPTAPNDHTEALGPEDTVMGAQGAQDACSRGPFSVQGCLLEVREELVV